MLVVGIKSCYTPAYYVPCSSGTKYSMALAGGVSDYCPTTVVVAIYAPNESGLLLGGEGCVLLRVVVSAYPRRMFCDISATHVRENRSFGMRCRMYSI